MKYYGWKKRCCVCLLIPAIWRPASFSTRCSVSLRDTTESLRYDWGPRWVACCSIRYNRANERTSHLWHHRHVAPNLVQNWRGVQNRHPEFRRITFLLLYPTVYDLAITVDEDNSLSGELVRSMYTLRDSAVHAGHLRASLWLRLKQRKSSNALPMFMLRWNS